MTSAAPIFANFTTDRRRIPGVIAAFVAIVLAVAGLTAQPAQAADTGAITGDVFTQAVGASSPTGARGGYIYWSYSATKDGAYSGSTGHSFTGSTFELTGLKAGFYKFEIAQVTDTLGSSAYEREYYNDADSIHNSTAVKVDDGAATPVEAMVLEPAGQITGRVTDRSGKPLANAHVAFERTNLGGGESAVTDSEGYYSSAQDPSRGYGTGLVRGSYRVRASLYGSSSTPDAPAYEQRYWKDAAVYDSATPVTVTPGASAGQINIQLDVAPRVRLTVKDRAGDPLPNVDVGIWMFYEGEWGPYRAGPNTTDDNGIYRKTVGIGERYKFFINPPAGVDGVMEWYDNAYTEVTAREISAKAHGEVIDLTIQLGDAPAVTGGPPTISGTPEVGQTLTAAPGTWEPAGVTVGFQWFANGVAIPGATAPRFKLTNSQAGKKVTVTSTGSLAGAAPVAAASAAAATVKGVLKAKKVSIKGTAKVGKKLRAKTSAWGPSPVKSSYKWYRNGRAISGQKKSTYKVRKADVGKRITVRVTQKKTSYKSVSKLSSKTSKVKKK